MTAVPRYRSRAAIAAASLVLGCAVSASAADFHLTPSIGLSQEYVDNVNQSATNPQTEWITRVLPGVDLRYTTVDSSWRAAYNLDYIRYWRNTRGDELNHRVNLSGSGALWGNFLYLEASDTLSRVSVDIARDVSTESAFANQTDQNLATVSPYLLWRYTEKGSLKAGYRYTDVRYWSGDGIDRRDHSGYLSLSQEVLTDLILSADYAFVSESSTEHGFDRHDLSGGLRYQYGKGGVVFGSIGNSWQSFRDGRKASNLFWDAGVSQDFRVLVATLESKVSYSTDPLAVSTKQTTHSLRLDHQFQRGTLGLNGSYSTYKDTFAGTDRTSVTIGAAGSYELLSSLTAFFNATGDRLSRRVSTDFPYHFAGSGGLRYAMAENLSLASTYTHISYRTAPANGDGSIEVNRVVLDLKKAF